MRRGKQHGFTLAELMVTVVIIGILAAVALPSYTSHVIKSNRTAAKAQMLDIANRQQQFFLSNRKYVTKTELQSSGYALPAELGTKYSYTLTVVTGANPSYTLKFTAIGSQESDGALTLTSDGVKGCDPACNPISLKW